MRWARNKFLAFYPALYHLMEDALRNKVLDWLNKGGFPLEMESAKAFRSAGFDVRQSATHLDPEEQKGREIDVLAQDPDWVGLIDIYFVLECKSSDKPWVILVAEDTLRNYNRGRCFAVTSDEAQKEISSNWRSGGEFKELIDKPVRCGYGFQQALGGKNDKAYGAAISVLKACSGLTSDREPTGLKRLAFAFPVIVVNSPIFECSLNSDGELELEEVQESEFLFSAHIPKEISCCIKVIRREKLVDYSVKAKSIADTVRATMKSVEDKMFGNTS